MIETIESKDLKGINKATEQIHVAAQFLSMVGEFLTETKKDGSHANLGWLVMKEKFITHPFGPDKNYVMELAPATMVLTIFNTVDQTAHEIALKGLKQKEVVKYIKDLLKLNNIEGAKKYKIELPYELPAYAEFGDKKFKKSPKRAFSAFSKLRTWGEHFVYKYSCTFPDADPVRTWPHHFDHASLVSIEKDKNGKLLKSIGLGLAIHDSMIEEPYFYISIWQKDKKTDLSKMKALKNGEWMNDGFKGSVLRISDVVEHNDFESRVDEFFKDSIEQLLKFLNYNVKSKNGK